MAEQVSSHPKSCILLIILLLDMAHWSLIERKNAFCRWTGKSYTYVLFFSIAVQCSWLIESIAHCSPYTESNMLFVAVSWNTTLENGALVKLLAWFYVVLKDLSKCSGANGASTCKLYADDLKLYSEINTSTDSITSSLKHIEDWSKMWQLKINCSKCAVLHVGRNIPITQYSIDQINLPNVTSIRDLGVVYNNKLNFDDHINTIVIRAYQRVNLIFRGFTSRNIRLLTRAFTTFVRPLLEYCTPAWSPYMLRDIDKIENVQHYFTRRLFTCSHYTYNERLFMLGLETLESRRLKYDIKLYYQIIHGLVVIDSSSLFNVIPKDHGTRGHDFRLQRQLYPTNSLANTFSNRAIDWWNSLPASVVSAPSFAAFKRLIKNYNLNHQFLRGSALES